LETWWLAYGDQRVDMERIYNLAKERKLLMDIRSGRSDRGARIAIGLELNHLKDRPIGSYIVHVVGIAHGGAAQYQLENISHDMFSSE